MVRIGGGVVSRGVTAFASGWGIVVVAADMAEGAVVFNGLVGAG